MCDLPLQYTAMKRLTLLLLFSFLSACSTMSKYTQNLVYSNNIPSAWTMTGRLSATNKGETESANFELNRKGKYHQLTLSNTLGFGQIQIQQTAQGLLVDDKLTEQTLQEWMRVKLGWSFPVEKLERLVFKHDLSNAENWQVKVSKYQVINEVAYPKIVRLVNVDKAIKIKLLLRKINRLK
ncbi:hypothetical protein MNB_SUP05-SYMBIONT-4-632 [hydrothermal vent metagenome]|uniref:Outer-membrane lipoprotein LolB n=1 Tax=hydrothermal vent metagenome TaxID=652676 RepID=A0A1W1DXI4_9ZZZZ